MVTARYLLLTWHNLTVLRKPVESQTMEFRGGVDKIRVMVYVI